MVMRVGGLASGMDIDALVEKLMKAERMPLDKTFQKKQTYEWQRDAYRGVNTKLKTFDTFLFDKMIMSGKMNQKSATSSNSELVSVTAKSNASGHISIGGVSQLATSSLAVGQQTSAKGNTRLSDLGISDTSIELKAIGADGKLAAEATKIDFDPNVETVDDLMKKINDSGAGVTAIFESGKLSISAKHTGSEKSGAGEIVATSGTAVFDALGFAGTDGKLASNGKNALFEINGIQTERSTNTFTISGYEMTLKKTFNEGDVAVKQKETALQEKANATANVADKEAAVSAAQLKEQAAAVAFATAYEQTFPPLSVAQENIYQQIRSKADLSKLTNEKINDLSTKTVEELKLDDAFKNFSDEELTLLKDNSTEINTLQQRAASELQYEVNKELLANDNAVDFLKNLGDKTPQGIADAIASLAEDNSAKQLLQNASTDDLLAFANKSATELDQLATTAKLNLQHQDEKTNLETANQGLAAANERLQTATVALQQAEEMVANVGGGTTNKVASVTMQASSDTKAAKEQIMEFVEKYNEMIESFNDQVKENKYRDFAPLTEEQRKDMSENEQKLWDEKAKSGLLRNDAILRDGMSKMRMTFAAPVGGLGDKMIDSLAEIGITTSKDYKTGKLVIDDKKLDAALEKDPDQVYKLFSQSGEVKKDENGNITEDSRGIALRLRDAMKEMTIKIEKKAGREGSVNNTFEIGKRLVDTENRFSKLQEKMKDVEQRYWKQFTAMEKAIQRANEQAGMFAQFGQ